MAVVFISGIYTANRNTPHALKSFVWGKTDRMPTKGLSFARHKVVRLVD